MALGFLIWMYLFRNDYYYFFRNMLFVSMGIALVGYIGFLTAPPRMYPASTDSLTRSTPSPASTTTRPRPLHQPLRRGAFRCTARSP